MGEMGRAGGELSQHSAVQFLSLVVARATHDLAAAHLRGRLIERSVVPLPAAVGRAVERGELVGDRTPTVWSHSCSVQIIFRGMLDGWLASKGCIGQTISNALAPWLSVPHCEKV